MDTLQNIIIFLFSVLKYGYLLFGGLPTFLFEAIPKVIPKLKTKYDKSKTFWRIIAIICLVIAVFLAWQDEHIMRIKAETQLVLVKHKEETRLQIAKFIDEGNKLKESCRAEIEKLELKPLYEDWVKRTTGYLSLIDPSYIPIFNGAIGLRYGGIGPGINEDIWNLINVRNQVLIKILEKIS